MSRAVIRPFREADCPAAYRLWQAALGADWPLSYQAFAYRILDQRAGGSHLHLVAESGGSVVGFAAVQAPIVPDEAVRRGSLMLLMVHPDRRREGIGTRLHDEAMATLAHLGVAEMWLGAGGLSYFWPGVPEIPTGAWRFFQSQGWEQTEESFDLVADLHSYSTPDWVHDRIRPLGIEISSPLASDVPDLLNFVRRHIPRWAIYYRELVEQGGLGDLAVARDAGGRILGSSYAIDSRREWQRYDLCAWHELLGNEIGGVGPLLVDQEFRNRGIGLELAARVTEMLKSRGLTTSFVGYTWLVDWYGSLGYRLWRRYRTSSRRKSMVG